MTSFRFASSGNSSQNRNSAGFCGGFGGWMAQAPPRTGTVTLPPTPTKLASPRGLTRKQVLPTSASGSPGYGTLSNSTVIGSRSRAPLAAHSFRHPGALFSSNR